MMQFVDTIIYWLPIIYIILVNLIAFIAMWWDKWKASKRQWRIAEVTLHVIGFIGGAIGIFGGMYRFRHKTQKKTFQAIAIIGLLVSFMIYWMLIQVYL